MENGKDEWPMTKLIGTILVIAGCGGFGMLLVISHKRKEQSLRQLIRALDFMECELQYRLTPLPDLCRQTAMESDGWVRSVFAALAQELDNQISPEVKTCMDAALAKNKDLPLQARRAMQELGQTMGRFDLPGQLRGLENVRQICRQGLEELAVNRDQRIRSYQTLSLCAGAALAILFI